MLNPKFYLATAHAVARWFDSSTGPGGTGHRPVSEGDPPSALQHSNTDRNGTASDPETPVDFSQVARHNGSVTGFASPHTQPPFSPTHFDCVVVDEGTDIKGGHTRIGQAVRRLNPHYRLVLTGTPVKNRIRDAFWLLWWVAGGRAEPHPLFPFGPRDEQRFAETFTRFHIGGSLSNELCNRPAWRRLTAPLILRRTKAEVAPGLPPKIE